MTHHDDEDDQKVWSDFLKDVKPLKGESHIPATPRIPSSQIKFNIPPSLITSAVRASTRYYQSREIKSVRFETVIDLHGCNQEKALEILENFVKVCQYKGYQWVLIITGKGQKKAEGGYGIIRSLTIRWLEEHPEWIIGYAPSPARHGGEGAFYVHLRKAYR